MDASSQALSQTRQINHTSHKHLVTRTPCAILMTYQPHLETIMSTTKIETVKQWVDLTMGYQAEITFAQWAGSTVVGAVVWTAHAGADEVT